MAVIYRKELGQLFHSIIGYVFLAIFMVMSAGNFVLYNLLAANGDVRAFFSPFMSSVMFLLPVLTMRSYSEERKLKTEALLQSAPISCAAVVLGKFFAILTLFFIGLIWTGAYMAVLAAFGSLDALMLMGNYAGMLVSASAFISIGMLISFLTENQIIACIATYAILSALWLLGYAKAFIVWPWLGALISQISVSSRFFEFSIGIFDVSTIVYYLGVTVFFLFIITVLAERRRQS